MLVRVEIFVMLELKKENKMISKKKNRNKCGSKIKYNSLEDAKKAAAIFAKKKGIITIMRAYGCHCGKFHIGRTKEIDWSKVK